MSSLVPVSLFFVVSCMCLLFGVASLLHSSPPLSLERSVTPCLLRAPRSPFSLYPFLVFQCSLVPLCLLIRGEQHCQPPPTVLSTNIYQYIFGLLFIYYLLWCEIGLEKNSILDLKVIWNSFRFSHVIDLVSVFNLGLSLLVTRAGEQTSLIVEFWLILVRFLVLCGFSLITLSKFRLYLI